MIFGTFARQWTPWFCFMLLISGCASTPEAKEEKLNPTGARAAAIIGKLIAPSSWDDDRHKDLVASIHPLEYHGTNYRAITLIHARFLIPEDQLKAVLADLEREHPDLARSRDAHQHAFGDESHRTRDDDGKPRTLSWWKPAREEKHPHYFWMVEKPGQGPTARTWLQPGERRDGKREVYLRFESD